MATNFLHLSYHVLPELCTLTYLDVDFRIADRKIVEKNVEFF
jgi:hypothetical protein